MRATIFISIILFFFLIKFPFNTWAQDLPVDNLTGLITYQEVVEEPGTKDELFNRCSSWLHTFYANPWEATKVRDQSTGLIKIQHQFRIYDTDEEGSKKDVGMILYSVKLEFKENRYRYIVDNFLLKQVSRYPIETWLDQSRPDYDEKWQSYLGQINSFVTEQLIKSLKEKMLPAQEIIEEDW